MATEPTGFQFNKDGSLVDFYDIFQTGDANITTGFISNSNSGKDLGRLFMGGNSGITTGYKNSSNQDLGSLFINSLPFTTTGTSTLVTTSNTYPNYCYAIFTDAGTITTKTTSGTLYVICIGGGGAGGWSNVGISCGGGGGGGVDYKTPLLSTIDSTLTVSVGTGGIATIGIGNGSGSNLIYTSGASSVSISATGGGGGTDNASGFGGEYTNSSGVNIQNGGRGGDRTSGNPWGQVENPSVPGQLINIPVPLALTGIINSAYSGGGGGGKGDSLGFITGGGGGGNGIGGPRPAAAPYSSYDGQAGLAFGGGGGGGGWAGTVVLGGNGANGAVIVYAEI